VKRLFLILSLIFVCAASYAAQKDSLNTGLDSTYLKKMSTVNDYSMIGIQYGVALSNASFQPDHNQLMTFKPINIGILYTKYCKMFGYMPYFGLQLGLFYTEETIEFKPKENGSYSYYILGAAKREMKVLEVPFMAHFHYDFWKMKLMANVGIYGGWRLDIQRSIYIDNSPEMTKYANCFHEKENQFDYGLKAGVGFAFILDPIEIHITGAYKYSWSNLHWPNTDYAYNESKYYYNWSYPTNIVIAVGVHYQLTKRVGYTRRELKQQAKEEAMKMMAEVKNLESNEENNSENR